jgi:hypothetical protein
LIKDGGEEPGYLVQDGIAADILASEPVKKEKGDSFLNETKSNSNLKFEDFRPHHLKRSKLDAFMYVTKYLLLGKFCSKLGVSEHYYIHQNCTLA